MDLALNKENVTPLLIDTESKTLADGAISEKPADGSESCKISIGHNGKLPQQNILDKDFSIDEDDLATPLEPIQVDSFPVVSNNGPTTDESSSNSIADDDGFVEEVIEDENTSEIEEKQTESDVKSISPCLGRSKSFDSLSELFPNNGPDGGDDADLTDTIPENIQDTELLKGTNDQVSLTHTSILRKAQSQKESSLFYLYDSTKRVSFPTDESKLVSFREADDFDTWEITQEMSAEEILQLYQDSCIKHKSIELDTIKNQIMEIKNNNNHSATLKLCSVNITSEINDTFEDLLRVANFHTVILTDCKFSPETMNEFLNMLEYYDSVCHLEIEMNFDDEDLWTCFCTACSNISVLESVSLKKMNINETYMRSFLRAVKTNSNITTLKFDGCMLVKLPSFYLVENLMANRSIRELYLSSTGLYTKEAEVIARFLTNNSYLKVLDISNNFIGDRGLESLAKGLCTQNEPGFGISALSIYNNQITEKSGPIINSIIVECRNMHTLNIGYNNLTDEVLNHINISLPFTQSLEGLGLQCTLLTCKGIYALAAAIPNNTSLRKINLKGNKAIQVNGVEKLCQALTNSKINKIEIDENNRSCSDPEAYSQLVKKLYAICTVNKSFTESTDEPELPDISHMISRKMSLNCEPKYTVPESSTAFHVGSSRLSPIPSPVSSPSPKSRFQIVKVNETTSTSYSTSASPSPTPRSKSRFQVTRVPQSPDEDVSLGRFANVRSSVSSNDSMDSLTMLHLDSDSD